jgi:hypothetical protein
MHGGDGVGAREWDERKKYSQEALTLSNTPPANSSMRSPEPAGSRLLACRSYVLTSVEVYWQH